VRNIQFTPQARRDLLDIWEHIAQDNLDAADRVVAAIDEASRLLAHLPGIGHTRPDVSDPRYRFWRVHSYLLAYRVSETDLVIIRLIHGARDVRRLLGQ
jgi:toxin ParE1/3/4